MLPEKIDSLADDVKSVVLELLRQNSGLTARVDELVAQNKVLLARIAELEAEHGKPPKTPYNSSLPPSRGQKGNVAEPTKVKKARKGHPGAARARIRELLAVPLIPIDAFGSSDFVLAALMALEHACPCCGSHMRIIETFLHNRGTGARAPYWPDSRVRSESGSMLMVTAIMTRLRSRPVA
jgi:hypothetical protein